MTSPTDWKNTLGILVPLPHGEVYDTTYPRVVGDQIIDAERVSLDDER